jgi:hypothetical protein
LTIFAYVAAGILLLLAVQHIAARLRVATDSDTKSSRLE